MKTCNTTVKNFRTRASATSYSSEAALLLMTVRISLWISASGMRKDRRGESAGSTWAASCADRISWMNAFGDNPFLSTCLK